MANFRGDRVTWGSPGDQPRWSRGDNDGVGTAYSAASRLSYTIWNGIVTDIYYPSSDRPRLGIYNIFSHDRIPCVAERYLEHHPPAPQIQFWTFAR